LGCYSNGIFANMACVASAGAGASGKLGFQEQGAMSVSDQFRELIRESGVSRYRLAKESAGRLHQSELASFLAGRSRLGLAKLDIVAELLGGVTVSRKRRNPARQGV